MSTARPLRAAWGLCLCLGLVTPAGHAQLAFLLEDEESPAIERHLRRERLARPPAPEPDRADLPAKWTAVYGLSTARTRSRQSTLNLPLALQVDFTSTPWSLAVETDGPTWQRDPDQSARGFNDVDLWLRWSGGATLVKTGVTVGSRTPVGSDHDRAFLHVYRKARPAAHWKLTGVVSLRHQLNRVAPDRHAGSCEMVIEAVREWPGPGLLQAALAKATVVKPEGRPASYKLRAGVDAALAGGTFTPFVTHKRKAGASDREIGFDLTWEY